MTDKSNVEKILDGVWVSCEERLPEKRHAINNNYYVFVITDSGNITKIDWQYAGIRGNLYWLDTTGIIPDQLEKIKDQRDIAIRHIAQWCASLRADELRMVDWSGYYQEALPEIHDLLMAAIELERKARG